MIRTVVFQGGATVSGDERTTLDSIQEFEQTFEQKYARKMTNEERRMLEAAKEIIQRRLGIKYLKKAAD